MTLPVFPITSGTIETIYPVSSIQVQFGNGYVFTAPPSAPDQRTFRLNLTGMRYYPAPAGGLDTNASTYLDAGGNRVSLDNLGLLESFYQSVRMYGSFTFNHPVWGALVCQFAKPLSIPKGYQRGNGTVEDFTIELRELLQ